MDVPHKKRPRMLYPSLWDSEKVAQLSDKAFRLYIWLITQADDEGRADYFWARLATGPWPFNPPEEKETLNIIHELTGLVAFYEVEGKTFYEIRKWDSFQRVRKDRYESSTYPQPVDNQLTTKWQPTVNQVTTNCQPSDNPNAVSMQCQCSDREDMSRSGGPPRDVIPFKEILEDLNEVCSKSFATSGKRSEASRELIRGRWKEGWRLDDFKRVHRNMSRASLDGSWGEGMAKYLRPSTLYRKSHFETYLTWESGEKKKAPIVDWSDEDRARARAVIEKAKAGSSGN